MHPIILTASAIVLAGAALASVGLAVRIQQKTREPLAALYLFYLVFAVLNGFFSRAAPFLAQTLLKPAEAGGLDSGTELLLPYLSEPLAIVAALLFFTMMVAAVNRTPSPGFTIGFILVTGIAWIAQGIAIYAFHHPDRVPVLVNPAGLDDFWPIVLSLVMTGGILFAIHGSSKLHTGYRRLLVRQFAFAQLILLVVRFSLFCFPPEHASLMLVREFVIFAGDLWPLLLLDRGLPRMASTATETTSDMLSRFSISPREQEIVERICAGKSNNEIADELFISLQTVKTHTYRIYRKLGVRNRIQMTNLLRRG